MRKNYKNKRDQYKAERDAFEIEAKLLRKKCEDKKKGFSCNVYCSHCQTVYGAIVPRGQSIRSSGCAHCGVANVGYLVTTIKKNLD